MAARQQRHLPVRDQRVVLRRSNDRDVDREGHDRDPDPEDEMGDVAPDTLVLDHQ